MTPEDRSFKHSGKLGDILYALPAVRAMGGGLLYLAESEQIGFTTRQIQSLIPLLLRQPYIRGVKIWTGQKAHHDLDDFRLARVDRENLASIFLSSLGLPQAEKDRAWIDVPVSESVSPKVVMARSSWYHGVPGFWPAALDRFGHDAVFVGRQEEHQAFCSEFGEIPYHPTADLLELAVFLKGAELFIGNQSCPYAIAEGLKIRTIQETDKWAPNCVFHRPNAYYVSNSRHLAALASGADLYANAEEVALAAKPKVERGLHIGKLGPASLSGSSVIVLTYNSMSSIVECLDSVQLTLSENDELIVIDNASSDGTAEYLQRLVGEPGITVILNEENRGFSAACNQAALVSKGAHIVWLNPDTLVLPGWLEAMGSRFNDPSIGAVGPVSNAVSANQFVGFHLPEDYSGGNSVIALSEAVACAYAGRSLETKLLIGFCFMAPRLVLDAVGLFNESMFLGSEDLELSWRLRELGYKLLVARDVFVAHKCGASFASLDGSAKERMLEESSRALVSIIRAAYAPVIPPTSAEIWGIDIVPDELMLMDLEEMSNSKKSKNKKKPPEKAAPKMEPVVAAVVPAVPAKPVEAGFNERWYSEDSMLALEALGHKVRPLTGAVVELGCWEGVSTCALAGAVQPEPVIAVDTWRGNIDESPEHATVQILKTRDVKAVFEANIAAFTPGNVEIVVEDCHEFLAALEVPVKLCHIDACHDYLSVKRAIQAVLPKVVPGGILCGDDILNAHRGRADLAGGVERAVSETLPGHFRRGNFWYWVNAA